MCQKQEMRLLKTRGELEGLQVTGLGTNTEGSYLIAADSEAAARVGRISYP